MVAHLDVSLSTAAYLGSISVLMKYFTNSFIPTIQLALKAPVITAEDDRFCIFPNFGKHKVGIMNCLSADDSHEIACLVRSF